MSGLGTFDLVAAATHLAMAITWGAIAYVSWQIFRFEPHRGALRVFLPIVSTLFGLHFALHLAESLASGSARAELRHLVELAIEIFGIASGPLFVHVFWARPGEATSRRFVVVNYGLAGLAAALALLGWLVALPGVLGSICASAIGVYSFASMGFAFFLMARGAQPRGGWHQGVGFLDMRRADVIVIGVAFAALAAMLAIVAVTGSADLGSYAALFLHTAAGIALAVPFAVRMLGRVLPLILEGLVLIPGAALVFLATSTLAGRTADPSYALLIHLLGLVALLILLLPGSMWLHSLVDRLLFGRSQLRQAELFEVSRGLSADLTSRECCERALIGLRKTMGFSGACIFLAPDEEGVCVGRIPLERLVPFWRASAAAGTLPTTLLRELDLVHLPPELGEALRDTDVVCIAPIKSPRRPWGHLLIAEPLLARPLGEGDEAAIGAFLDQVALVLDGGELLRRAVDVERTLAHAEKLAALGELSARIAHEIRNPITAARSLAQQLAREEDDRFPLEHETILAELERVERRVAALLRFARREDLHRGPVDLTHLVRAAVADLAPGLSDAGIALALEADEQALLGSFDADKMRQVVVNLVENARDALIEADAERRDPATFAINGRSSARVRVVLHRNDGSARLSITDTGPGVAREDLPKLFEPFFSRKPAGTGLGLAIVRQTIEAHGGRITAALASPHGMTFDIELPLDEGERA